MAKGSKADFQVATGVPGGNRKNVDLVEQIRAEGTGFIVRTVAEGASEEQLVADMQFLCKLWADIEKRAQGARPPSLIYADLDLSLRTVRDLFSGEVERLIVDDQAEFARIKEFVGNFVPSFLDAVELYQGSEPALRRISRRTS